MYDGGLLDMQNLCILTDHNAQIDITMANGPLVFNLFATLAEYEQELIIECTHAGLKTARVRGRLGERSGKMDVATLKHSHACNDRS